MKGIEILSYLWSKLDKNWSKRGQKVEFQNFLMTYDMFLKTENCIYGQNEEHLNYRF